MKKREAYEYQPDKGFFSFTFESIGPKGSITKFVQFSYISNKLWNLGFGDYSEGDWDDAVISDNNDMRKVLQTVVNIVHDFSEKYPNKKIYIEPVDKKDAYCTIEFSN